MKKMLIFILLTTVALFIVQSCTTINLSPKLLVNKSAYNKFPELDDGLGFGKYEMERITKTSGAELSYFPQKNFFFISSASKPGTYNPIKIDSFGRKVFELHLDERHEFKLLDYTNGFVIGEKAIYDFSSEHPISVSFHKLVNKENNIEPKNWIEIFEDNYRSADIVLYSQHTEIIGAQCVYFRTAGKWTKLYEFNHLGRQFIYPDGYEIKCRINNVNILQKLNEEHYLKDVQYASYSNSLRYSDHYIKRVNKTFPDQTLSYKQAGDIKTLAFSKETSTSEGYMNPGIPTEFYGTAFYELKIGNDLLNFKNNASKHNGFGEKVQTDMYVFNLPEKFLNKSSVSFLTYDYGTNVHENGKKGVYVIRKNENTKE